MQAEHTYSKALLFATSEELAAVKDIEALIRSYVSDGGASRPLSIAVFGAPGSGKSRIVKAIVKKLTTDGVGLGDVEKATLNLTQLSTAEQLEAQLEAILAAAGGAVPVVFFDEFDAPRAGAPLGWLPWFLAPMEDGARFARGMWHPIPRAVFIFAGGTSPRAEDFGRKDPASFRAAKGPDFMSRLRGFLDVLGPNDGAAEDRAFRREAAFTYQLDKGLAGKGPASQFTATPTLLAQLRDVGRFRHGDRSIGAVLELCARSCPRPTDPNAPPQLDLAHLPPDHILALHVDAGPLDPLRIGGAIGLSCNFDDAASAPAMKELALDQWRHGARIAYFRGDATTDAFRWRPTEQAQAQPTALSRNRYAISRVTMFVGATADAPAPHDAVEVVRVPGLETTREGDQLHWSPAELFRMRWMMNCRCVARVLAAGRSKPSPGRRIQGLLEEGMLALATGQPVYVLGAFGGTARYLGGLLGLATRPVPASVAPAEIELPERIVTLGGALDLPARSAEIPDYLTSFAIGSARWPDNGLSVDENRTLFEAESPEEITRLVRTGLHRRFED